MNNKKMITENRFSNPVNVLVMCLNDPSGNPRPKRVIELCNKLGYTVSIMSYATKEPIKVSNYFLIFEPNKKNLIKRFVNKFRNLCVVILRLLSRGQKFLDYINNYKLRLFNASSQLKTLNSTLL
jgi:hypothetical protein